MCYYRGMSHQSIYWNLPLKALNENLQIVSFKLIFSAIVSQFIKLALMATWFGMAARCSFNRHFRDGTISQEDHENFSNVAHFYFKNSFKNIQKTFAIDNDIINNSVWIDVTQRIDFSWQYFLDTYCLIKSFENINHGKVYDDLSNITWKWLSKWGLW